jgi:hypothetical protein
MTDEERSRILESLFLEMLGTKTELALQFSRIGAASIENALAEALADSGISHRTGPSGSIIAVGDYVWESYGIPMAILSRYPYPEYHCSRDNFSLMNESSLEEAVAILLHAIDKVESTSLVFKKFQGTICASNPRYNLYVDPGQPAFGDASGDITIKGLRFLMEQIPMLNRPVSIRSLAAQAGIEEPLARGYLEKWADRGLLEIK